MAAFAGTRSPPMASSPTHQRPLRHTPDHPPYSAMISEAIRSLAEAGGSKPVDISDKIKSIYDDLPLSHDKLFPYYLNKFTAKGEFVAGADGRFSIAGDKLLRTQEDVGGLSVEAINERVGPPRRRKKKQNFTQEEVIDEENAKPAMPTLKPDVVSAESVPNNKEKVSVHMTEERKTNLPEESCLDGFVLALPAFCRPKYVPVGNTAEKLETEVETMVKGKLAKLQFRRQRRNQRGIENEQCSSNGDVILEVNLPKQDKDQTDIDNEQFVTPTILGLVGQPSGNIDFPAQVVQLDHLTEVMEKNHPTESGNKQNLVVSTSVARFDPLLEEEKSAADISKQKSDVEVEPLQALPVPSATGHCGEASLMMPKRRGRPPKRKAPSNDYLMLTEEGQTETNDGDKSIIGNANSLQPKRRGRPRKIISDQISGSETVVHSSSHELKYVSDPAVMVMPKRRGRPRKIKSDQISSSESVVHPSSHELKSVSDPAVTVMPKRRGRPPKNSKPDIATRPTPSSGALPPKCLGRPPKNKG